MFNDLSDYALVISALAVILLTILALFSPETLAAVTHQSLPQITQ